MKSYYNILLFAFLTLFLNNSYAQISISFADPEPNLAEVYGGSFASGDIDNDGDRDLLLTGIPPSTSLYLNDGLGGFTEIGSDLPNRGHDTVTEFLDLDNDGDLDLYFSGMNDGGGIGEFTRIYLNDGVGNFSLTPNPDLPQFRSRGAAFSDIDNDGDYDLFISAIDENNQFIASTYLNDGSAHFTPLQTGAFSLVKWAAIAFIDIENDNDMDLIVAGTQPNNSPLTKLYINDGAGNYTPDNVNDFENLQSGMIDIADTDNDGDQDILLSGENTNFVSETYLYVNDGSGNFDASQNTNLQPTLFGNQAIADIDLDGDQDILIVNPNGSLIYENVGNNVFNMASTLLEDYIGDCLIADFNNDGYPEIITQGIINDISFYWNNSGVLNNPDFIHESSECILWPNPVVEHLNIRLNVNLADQNYTIHDLTGRIIRHGKLANQNTTLDLSGLNQGLYFIKIDNKYPLSFLKS